jgi:peptidoglycan/LPS O-acetylase OafA/YrhL
VTAEAIPTRDGVDPGSVSEDAAGPRLTSHLAGLDGVRGLAVLLVMAVHFVGGSTAHTLWQRVVVKAASYGWVGVDLFFVLSGFLITGLLIEAKGSPRYFRNFYARRTLRIFPLYYFVLACLFLILPLLTTLSPLLETARLHQIWLWTYTSNFFIAATSSWDTLNYVSHFWSLAIEEQFYLGLPVLLLWIFRRRFGPFAAVMLLVPPLLRCLCLATGWRSPWDFTPCRLDAPFWGVLAAVLVRDARGSALMLKHRRALRWTAGAGLLGVAALSQLALVPGGANLVLAIGLSLIAMTFTVALISVLLSPEAAAAARLVRWPPLRWAGKHSYFLYLFHLIIVRLIPIPQLPLRLAVSTCALVLLAAISRRWLELPFLNLGAAVEYGEPAQRAQLQPYP